MRKVVMLSAVSTSAAALATALVVGYHYTRSAAEPMTADLERDLKLAISVQRPHTAVTSAIELHSNAAPSGNQRGQRLAVPTKRRAPSPARSTTVADVADVPETADDPAPKAAPVVAQEAHVTPVPEPVATAPAPEPTSTASAPVGGASAGTGTEGDHGRHGAGNGDGGRRGGGIGGSVGAIMGVIIRGGMAGVDHCEPPGRRRQTVGGSIGTILGGISRIPVGGSPQFPNR